ncbi:MAG: DUF4350 domain-containing protein [Blastomonas sp.]
MGNANPFSRLTVGIIFAIGFAAFLGLLYALGAGESLRNTNNGDGHAASNSLIGYSALYRLLEETGSNVGYARNEAMADTSGLMILTPSFGTDPDELASFVERRAYTGPTLVILPKWFAAPFSEERRDWVRVQSPAAKELGEALVSKLVDAKIELQGMPETKPAQKDMKPANGADDQDERPLSKMSNAEIRELLAEMNKSLVQAKKARVTISGDDLVPMIIDGPSGKAQVALIRDDGWYPDFDPDAPDDPDDDPSIDQARYPVFIAADADLFNNKGMASRARAEQAIAFIDTISEGDGEDVTFDLTRNGLGTADNLLSLAFRPPFISAVICLVLAALALAWIAFNRFGPPLREARAVNFGKSALVTNSAGLVRRLGRDHVLSDAYADLVRERAARALGLPQGLPRDEVEARLDALGNAESDGFGTLSASLRSATKRIDIVRRAAALFNWKKDRIG